MARVKVLRGSAVAVTVALTLTLTVKDSSVPLDLTSANGPIVAERVPSKRVKADSDTGSVRVAFTAVPDLVETSSDNGGISIALPRATYSVTAKSDNGEVTVRSAN